MDNEIYRQGDVLLVRIAELPKEATRKDNIVAFGETTGHKHQFDEGAVVYKTASGQQVVQIQKTAILQHEEHKHLTIPKGIYEIRIQREFDVAAETRRVMD